MALLIDNSMIINQCYSVFVSKMHEIHGDDYVIKKDDLDFFYHLYFRKIKEFFSYKNIVFCGEGHNSTKWRKDIYPLYKENRKARKENPDYDFIYDCYVDVEKLLKYLPCKSLRTENCEADDEIYKLSEYFSSQKEPVTIVSTDKDLTQIGNFFDEITIYNPVKKEIMTPSKDILLEKAIVGDKSDNIQGIPRIGKKTLEKMLLTKEEWNKIMTPEREKLFNTIMQIVDLRKFPKEFQDAIIDNYEKTPYNEFDTQGVQQFFFEHNLKQCMNKWSEWSAEIYSAQKGNSTLGDEAEIEAILNG